MNDLVTRLTLDLRNDRLLRGLRASGVSVQQLSNNIDRDMRRSDRAVTRFARNARRELGMLDRMTGGVFGSFKGEILALGSAWASIGILKDAAQLEKVLTRMTQTAGVSRRETAKMRQEYFAIQKMNGVTVEESRAATDKMLQSGMGLNESLTSTRAITNTSAVSHANSATIASGLAVGAQAFGWDLARQGVAQDKLDKMYLAGDLGSAELENLSGIFAKMGVHAKTAGMTFEGTLGFVEQLSKTEQNPERLATLAESTLRIFNNKTYQKKI
ncbi:MAG: phage tail tape measure protein, partial [Pseudomonadales bacterium]